MNQHVTKRGVARRYNVTSRTVDRWAARPELGFPKPMLINGRKYFTEADLIDWERARAASSASGVTA